MKQDGQKCEKKNVSKNGNLMGVKFVNTEFHFITVVLKLI